MSELSRPTAILPFTPHQLVGAFLDGLAPTTIAAYRRDLDDFRRFVGGPDLAGTVELLITAGLGEANALVLAYRAHLMRHGRAPATINRRLSSLRALVALARTVGLVAWRLEVKSLRARPYRDSRGPERRGVLALLDAAEAQAGRKASRDVALLRLLYDLALRRGEVCGLDLDDVDWSRRRLLVTGKGQREKLPISLPDPTWDALRAWVAVRGESAGPLFLSFDPSGKGATHRRLTGQGIWAIVKRLGQRAGLNVRPHALRHAAITAALEATGGNVRAVQRFSRHADLNAVLIYDDNRTDLGGAVARLVAAGL